MKTAQDALTTAIAPAMWGTTYLVAKNLLPPGGHLFDAAARALPAGLLLVALARTLPPRGEWGRTALLSLITVSIPFVLIFVAAAKLPGGVAAVIAATSPLLTALFAPVLLGEALSVRRIGASLIGAAGVAIVVLRSEAALDPIGIAAALGAAISMSLGAVLAKRWGQRQRVLPFTGWQLLIGGAVLAVPGLLIDGIPTEVGAPALAGYAYLAILGTGLGFALWFRGLGRLPASAASFLILVVPVSAALAGWFFAGEALTAPQAAGAALVFLSVAMGVAVRTRPGRTQPFALAPAPAPAR